MNIKSNKAFTITELFVGFIVFLFIAAICTAIGAVVYTLIHFIAKFW